MDQPQTPHRFIAQRVRELRAKRGWSAQRLAEEMTAAGMPWERMVVTKLENGRRQGISVEEWLTLAYVLDVAPIHLLIPTENENEPYGVVPNSGVRAGRAREWVRGAYPLPSTDQRLYFSEVPKHEWAPPAVQRLAASHHGEAIENGGNGWVGPLVDEKGRSMFDHRGYWIDHDAGDQKPSA